MAEVFVIRKKCDRKHKRLKASFEYYLSRKGTVLFLNIVEKNILEWTSVIYLVSFKLTHFSKDND